MLPWQKKHIQKHWSVLVENLESSAKLIDNLLKTDDLSSSLFKASIKTKDQSTSLYETLLFSAKGYETLTRAAYESGQTEILKILLNGFRNQGIKDPLTQCRIPLSISAIQSTEIKIRGCNVKIENVFSESDLSIFEEIIRDNRLEEEYIDAFIIRRENQRLELPATTPPEPPIYIPRLVSNRLKLKPEIFQENLGDLFLLKGLQRHELGIVANRNGTSTFRKIAENQKVDKSCRFIWLDVSYENVWEEILKYSGETPVHLVKVEIKGDSGLKNIKDGQYILEATSGNIKSIHKWVSKKSREISAYNKEDDFVREIISNGGNPGFCICDTPGMGKSFLLASLARKVQQLHPDWVVVYTKLANFSKYLKGRGKISWMNPEIALNLVLEHVIPSQILVKLLVEAFTRGSKRLELFLDGLDELTSEEDLELMKRILQAIIKFQTGRGNVYVTARSHVQADLEETLGVAAYDILPFSSENQIEFLKKSWMERWKVEDVAKSELLEGFAKICLKKIEETFSAQVKEIMGIPLKCFLLAGIHEEDAKRVLRQKEMESDPIVKNYSIYDLLDKYVDTRKSSRNDCDWEEVKNWHMWKALEVQVGNAFASKYADFKKLNTDIPEEYYSFGILTKSANEAIFIHQTFIEFLVILCLGELFKCVNCDLNSSQNILLKELISHLANDIVFRRYDRVSTIFPNIYPSYIITQRHSIDLQTFIFPNQVHLYFFNKYLWNNDECINPLTSNKILATSLEFLYDEPYSILQCSFYNNYVYTLRFIKNIFQNGWKQFQSLAEPSIELSNESTKQSPIVLLIFLAACTSSVEIMRELAELLGKCDKKLSQVEFPISNDFKITPIHIAVGKGSYEMFEYLWNEYDFKPEELLLWCTYNTLYRDSFTLKEKQEICEFLISNLSKDNLKMALEDAIYEIKVNSELISFLLDKFKSNVKRFQTMRDLQSNQKALSVVTKLVKNVILEYSYPVHINDSLLKRILESSSFSLKLIDELIREEEKESGDNLLLALVRKKRGPVALKALEQDGLVNNFKNLKGQNALHVAATRYGKVEMGDIEYLHSKGVCLEEYDLEGNTPLLLAHGEPETIKFLLRVGANVDAINTKNRKNLLHLMSTHYPNHEKYIEEHLSGVKDLIVAGIDVNAKESKRRFPLLSYLHNNHESSLKYTRIADLLLDHGADIHAVDNEGNNLLFWGAHRRQNAQIFEYLEKKGVEWKGILNKSNDTILHMAAKGGNFEVLKYILSQPDCGDVNVKNNEGKTPLLSGMAFQKGMNIVIEMIKLFADKNADFTEVDNEGNNVIFLATYHGQLEKVLELLEEKNVDWKSKNKNGDCILHMATKQKNYRGLNYFLAKPDCVDINTNNNEGRTPLLNPFTRTYGNSVEDIVHHASYVKEIIDSLIKHENLDINAVDKDGNNALHLALNSWMPTKILESLKEGGCNPEQENNKGETFNQLLNISMSKSRFVRFRSILDNAYEDFLEKRHTMSELNEELAPV